MGIRIHRSMGYGMPWALFEELNTLPHDDDGAAESIHSVFSKLTDADLTIDDESYKRCFYTANVPPILEKRLLAEKFTNGGREETTLGRPHQLFDIAMSPDEIEHILFFPNLNYAGQWYRNDDGLDYAFEQYRDGDGSRGSSCEPRDFVKYLGYGPYPFTNYLMLEDGSPVPWDYYWEVERHPEWLPAVPSEIRWYLTRHGVLDNAGVNKLRPLIAQYWC